MPTTKRISPASAISGNLSLPGDKSISHRYALIGAIAEGDTRIANYSTARTAIPLWDACARSASRLRVGAPSS
ncbi:MAG: hypothetical protein WDO73_12450 [Ignavibacteriota bacterium]